MKTRKLQSAYYFSKGRHDSKDDFLTDADYRAFAPARKLLPRYGRGEVEQGYR